MHTYSDEHLGAGVPRKGECGSTKPVTGTAALCLPTIPQSYAAVLCRKHGTRVSSMQRTTPELRTKQVRKPRYFDKRSRRIHHSMTRRESTIQTASLTKPVTVAISSHKLKTCVMSNCQQRITSYGIEQSTGKRSHMPSQHTTAARVQKTKTLKTT